ncbi:MAG: site-specific integrase [Clostridia bacterium]|nr:site-specific integrase [Clostridia bacterium]
MKPPKATQLPSGSWNVRMRIKGQDISITRPTEAQAVAEAMAIRAGLKQPDVMQKNITLANAMDNYIALYRGTLSASTIRGYRYIRDHRFQHLMPLSIMHISREQWQAAIDRESRAVKPKTVKNAWGLVTAVLTDNGLRIPDVKLPQMVKNEHDFLSAEQIKVFIDAMHGQPGEMAALLGLHSLRRSEILDLTWDDIDLQRHLIHVRGAAVFGEDHKVVHQKTNKNITSRRDVPIMIDRLEELLATAPRPSKYIVTCNPNTISPQVNRVCAAAGLPLIGAHGLRHSFASLAKHVGMPEETAMKIGGWKDYTTMHKIYTHISQKDQEAKVQAMRDFYNGKNADKIADDK